MPSSPSADNPQKMSNRQTTVRGSLIAITGHFGQSIASARMNASYRHGPKSSRSNSKNQQTKRSHSSVAD